MTWNILTKTNEIDKYTVEETDHDTTIIVPVYSGHQNSILHNIYQSLKENKIVPNEHALDLLHIALSVYAADLRVPRQAAHDNWTRDFVLHLPVRDPNRWSNATSILENMLSFLTGDHWKVHFRQRDLIELEYQQTLQRDLPSRVSLFSGGLDSFIGVSDLMSEGEPIALISHYTRGPLSASQQQLLHLVENEYPGLAVPFRHFVQPPMNLTNETELTTRSRSILFLSLATTVASGIGKNPEVIVPENGVISINVPLTHSRTGSLSTRTTHPYFIFLYQSLLNEIGLDIQIKTPYRFKTKGEMLLEAKDQEFVEQGAHMTMSCSHPGSYRFQGGSAYKHCGHCVPCIIRRAALNRVNLDDPDEYNLDIRSSVPNPEDTKGRNLRAFQIAIQRMATPDFNPLLEVVSSGPLPDADDNLNNYIEVYRRGMAEVDQFLNG